MKHFLFLCIFLLPVLCANAIKVNGFYVSNNNDTVESVFWLGIKRSTGNLNLKNIRKGITYFINGKSAGKLLPRDVTYVGIRDAKIGQYNIYSLQDGQRKIFALNIIKGSLSVFTSKADNAMWILNKYTPPTEIFYYLTLNDAHLRSNVSTPFTSSFWLNYLREYPEFVACLAWDRKKRKEMHKLHKHCHLVGKDVMDIAELFNSKYFKTQ